MTVVKLLYRMKNKTHADIYKWSHRIDAEPSIYPSLPFRRCFALVGDEPAAEDHQGRRAHSAPLRQFRCGFFVTKNQAVAECQSILEWVPCLPWRQKAAWHISLFFFRMTTWHFSVSDLSHLQREIFRIVFGIRDCNDVLHTLGGSYLFYKTHVSMIISTY